MTISRGDLTAKVAVLQHRADATDDRIEKLTHALEKNTEANAMTAAALGDLRTNMAGFVATVHGEREAAKIRDDRRFRLICIVLAPLVVAALSVIWYVGRLAMTIHGNELAP